MDELIARYLAARPGAWLEDKPYPNQGMNSIVYRGTWHGEPAMFKFGIRNSARGEANALDYFADTGHVPRVLDVFSDEVLVTEYICGIPLPSATLDTSKRAALLSALCAIVDRSRHDAGADFRFIEGFHATLSEAVDENPELLSAEDFRYTMDAIDSNWSSAAEQTGALYYDDVGGENILLSDDGIYFIDLESVWAGNTTLQVGALVADARMSRGQLQRLLDVVGRLGLSVPGLLDDRDHAPPGDRAESAVSPLTSSRIPDFRAAGPSVRLRSSQWTAGARREDRGTPGKNHHCGSRHRLRESRCYGRCRQFWRPTGPKTGVHARDTAAQRPKE